MQNIDKDVLLEQQARLDRLSLLSPWTDTLFGTLTPEALKDILDAAVAGDADNYYLLAEEMEERNAHYAAVLATRKRSVASLPINVVSPTDDQKDIEIAAAVENEVVNSPYFRGLLMMLMDAINKGVSVVEINWLSEKNRWTPAPTIQKSPIHKEIPPYIWRDPRFFVWYPYDLETLRLKATGNSEGLEIPAYKFIIHRAMIRSGLPGKDGVARTVAQYILSIKYVQAEWMAYVERYGMPFMLGTYPPGTPPESLEALDRALFSMGMAGSGRAPSGMDIRLIESAKSNGDVFEGAVEYFNALISKAVLGQTMTTDAGSSLSQSQVHNDIRMEIVRSDASHLASTLNRDLIEPFVRLNFGEREFYPRIEIQIPKAENTEAMVMALEKLVPLGLHVEASVVRDRLGFSDPSPGSELMGNATYQREQMKALKALKAAEAVEQASPNALQLSANDGYVPNKAMQDEARRGLDWRREFGRGGTAVGIARARDIVNGKALSADTIKRMRSFFARHAVDKDADGFRPGENGFPSNGRIAWALWGGDAGLKWANAVSLPDEAATNAVQTSDDPTIDQMVDEMMVDLSHPIDMALIQDAIFSAEDEEDLIKKLAMVVEKTDPRWSRVLEKAAFAASVLGYINAEKGRI